jgi:hypothetical protein
LIAIASAIVKETTYTPPTPEEMASPSSVGGFSFY